MLVGSVLTRTPLQSQTGVRQQLLDQKIAKARTGFGINPIFFGITPEIVESATRRCQPKLLCRGLATEHEDNTIAKRDKFAYTLISTSSGAPQQLLPTEVS